MNIAIIIDGLACGGAERQAVLAAAELVRRDHYVEIIACHDRNDFADSMVTWGINYTFIGTQGPLRLGRVAAIARHLRRKNFDVVHCFKSSPSTYGRLAAKLVGVPLIFGGMRMEMADAHMTQLVNRLLNPVGYGWIANSECSKRAVIRDLGVPSHKVFVVPNGIEPERFRSALSIDDAKAKFGLSQFSNVVTMIANFRPEKNYPMFLRLAQRIMEAKASTVLVSAGHGPLRPEIENLCGEMGVGEYVRFIGQCNAVPDLLRATDVLVLTSYNEGLPNAILEASAAGIPCVATDTGGAGEIIKDGKTGYIVPIDDDQSMARRVLKLLTNPGIRRRTGQSAREMISKDFSVTAVGENLLRVYGSGLLEETSESGIVSSIK